VSDDGLRALAGLTALTSLNLGGLPRVRRRVAGTGWAHRSHDHTMNWMMSNIMAHSTVRMLKSEALAQRRRRRLVVVLASKLLTSKIQPSYYTKFISLQKLEL
jgi:hypothetical protein